MDEIEWPKGHCECFENDDECVCPDRERAFRAWKHGSKMTPPMTQAQRKWAAAEIASVEGYDKEETYLELPDAELAGTVLSAWVDYCRDKGLM